MSRPKKEEPKTKRITIRVTDLEYQTFTEEAQKQHITLAEYVRYQTIHGKLDIHYDIKTGQDELSDLCKEFHKIGINLNQIAKFLNSGGNTGQEMMEEIKESVSELFTLRQEVNRYMEDHSHGNPKTSRK